MRIIIVMNLNEPSNTRVVQLLNAFSEFPQHHHEYSTNISFQEYVNQYFISVNFIIDISDSSYLIYFVTQWVGSGSGSSSVPVLVEH